MILVDTNVLVDVLQRDPVWSPWSEAQLEAAAVRGPLCINDIVYAELSIAYAKIEEMEEVLRAIRLPVRPMPREALFVAGKAFRAYRRRRGVHRHVLPDFFIGAHAAVEGMPLLTRDPRRYRTSFPGVEIICPTN